MALFRSEGSVVARSSADSRRVLGSGVVQAGCKSGSGLIWRVLLESRREAMMSEQARPGRVLAQGAQRISQVP